MSLPRATAWPCPAVPAPGQPDLAGRQPASADPAGAGALSRACSMLLPAQGSQGTPPCRTQQLPAGSAAGTRDSVGLQQAALRSWLLLGSPRSTWQIHLGFQKESTSPHPRTLQSSFTPKTLRDNTQTTAFTSTRTWRKHHFLPERKNLSPLSSAASTPMITAHVFPGVHQAKELWHNVQESMWSTLQVF